MTQRRTWRWGDDAWVAARAEREPWRERLALYEVHLGSWARVPEEGDRCLSYRELAPRLVAHAQRYGFTHLELLPLMGPRGTSSWGDPLAGQDAPTARYGSPDDLCAFVDACHQAGIGVVLDWALPLPEPGEAERHADRVRSAIASALHWLDAYHVDGLRVCGAASLLARGDDAPDLLRALNQAIAAAAPGCFTIAEACAGWSVTGPVAEGGLGFGLAWSARWREDALHLFGGDTAAPAPDDGTDPSAGAPRAGERLVLPLSHDAVAQGQASLLARMPGDAWQKLARLRSLLAWQWTRPGAPLVFMGTELAQEAAWRCDASLDWHLADDPLRVGLDRFLVDLGALHRDCPCLWRWDHDPSGFQGIVRESGGACAYLRWDGDAHAVVVLNLAAEPRDGIRLGVPTRGAYAQALSTDAGAYGGSGHPTRVVVDVEEGPLHGLPGHVTLDLPPLAALVLRPLRS